MKDSKQKEIAIKRITANIRNWSPLLNIKKLRKLQKRLWKLDSQNSV